MQAIKDKITDMNATRKARSEAKHEEKAEKELAKSRAEVAHEIRLAREAEAAMDIHVNKAVEKAAQHDAKQNDHDNNFKDAKNNSKHEEAAAKGNDQSGGSKSSNIPGHLSKFM